MSASGYEYVLVNLNIYCRFASEYVYPKDPQIVPYSLATMKCSHAQTYFFDWMTTWPRLLFSSSTSKLTYIQVKSKKKNPFFIGFPKYCGEGRVLDNRELVGCQGVKVFFY